MKRKKRNLSVLMIVVTLLMMLLPVSEADAQSSASDFRMEGSTLVKYRGAEKNVSIPSTVEAIGQSAFEDNKSVELVVVPNSVKRIDAYAFWGCDNLDSVVLGRGLTEVSDYAFAKCTGLEQITIPANITSIGMQAFADCVNLKHITIPPETTSIHESAFDGCSQLVIHCEEDTVAAEYAEAFYERQKSMPGYGENPEEDASGSTDGTPGGDDSASGQSPEEPSQVQPAEPGIQGNVIGSTYIVGNRAVVMMDNTRLQVYGSESGQNPADADTEGISVDNPGGNLTKYTIVDGKTVADQAYYRNESLESAALPEGIREIGEFSYARSSLTAVTIPEGTERIGYSAFYHCDALEEVNLPDTVRCVAPKAFSQTAWVNGFLEGESSGGESDFLVEGGILVAYRGNAAEVKIPEGVRVIAGEAFLSHGEIQSVVMPDSLLVVGEGAFEGCGSLGGITFGANVEEIKDRAFLGNVIPEISVPASVKKLGIQAFGNTVLSYEGEEPEQTYEASATRLSNAAYRVYPEEEEQTAGVTVEGLEEVFGVSGNVFRQGSTSLTDADRSYTLTVKTAEDTAAMEAAFQRALQAAVPEGMLLYDLELTDASGIPLKKLGKQTLSVVLPLAETFSGQELQLYTLDGNGQLERLAAETVTVDGVEAFRFEVNHLSVIGVCGVR